MPDLRRRNCQICRKPDTEVGPISWRGRCQPCGIARAAAAAVELAEHEGPMFDRWRAGMAGCVGATIPPNPETRS